MKSRPLSVTVNLILILLDSLFWFVFGVIVIAGLHPGLPDLPFIKEIMALLAFATAGIMLLVIVLLGKHNRIGYFLGVLLFAALSLLSLFDDFGWTDLVVLVFHVVPLILLIVNRAWYLQVRTDPVDGNYTHQPVE